MSRRSTRTASRGTIVRAQAIRGASCSRSGSSADARAISSPEPPSWSARPQWSATTGFPMTTSTPPCARCHRPHRVDLPCWEGRYRVRVCDQVYREKGRACWQCKREGKSTPARTVDHVLARARGGGDEMRNLEPACARHNSSKGAGNRNPYGPEPPIAGNGEPVSPRFR